MSQKGRNIMKKSRIALSFLSVFTAVTALSSTASAVYVRDGDTPIFDLTPTIEGELKIEHTDLGGGNGKVSTYYVDKDGDPVTGYSVLYIDASDKNEVSSDMVMYRIDSKTGEIKGKYTGFAKNTKGRRYYKNGKRVYGWYKIGKKWYHFNEDGYADTGRTKVCGTYYTFDKKGKWTGKVSSKGLAPKDFSVKLSVAGLRSFDTKGNIYYGSGWDADGNYSKYEKKIDFSAGDRQIMYCMFLESGFSEGKNYKYDNAYLDKKIADYTKDSGNKELSAYSTSPVIDYKLTVTCNKKTSEIVFTEDAVQLIHVDKKCFNAYVFAKNLKSYYTDFLIEKFPEPEKIDWEMLD